MLQTIILKAKCVTLGSNLVLLLSRRQSGEAVSQMDRIWVVIRLADGKMRIGSDEPKNPYGCPSREK